MTRGIFQERLKDIARFEDYLARNGTTVLKFFLHVSREEQKKRFIERLDDPAKNWKFSLGDVKERAYWDEYMAAYEEAIRETATPACALVCSAGGQQVVYAHRGLRRHRRRPWKTWI